MIRLNIKSMSGIIATMLLIVTAVVAISVFQFWYLNYSGDLFAGLETRSNQFGKISIEDIIGDSLYIKSTGNLTITNVKVGDYSCGINQNISKGVTEIDISDCLDYPFSSKSQDIVVIAGSQILTKKFYMETLDLSDTTFRANATLLLPLITSITPTKSSVYPMFSRSTTATVVDFEGVVHTAKIDETRFSGARRVENLLEYSENLSNSVWEQTNISGSLSVNNNTITLADTSDRILQRFDVKNGTSYVFKIVLKGIAGTKIRLMFFDGLTFVATKTITFTGEYEEYSLYGTSTNTENDGAQMQIRGDSSTTTIIDVKYTQIEKNTGSQTESSEYVSTGVLSYPYHGANVDGVKYFDTDRAGNKIADNVLQGYLNEPEGTNLLTYSEDFENTAWMKLNSNININITNTPNNKNIANKLISTNNNIIQGIYTEFSLTIGNIYTQSIYVKSSELNLIQILMPEAIFGFNAYANFDLSDGTIGNIGSSSSAIIENIGNGWYRCSCTATAIETNIANGGFYLIDSKMSGRTPSFSGDGTSGIYIWGAQLEQSPFATSYIKTTSSTATRSADSLTLDNTDNAVLPNSFAFAGTWTPLGDGDDYELVDIRLFGSQDSRGNAYEQRTNGDVEYNYNVLAYGGSLDFLNSMLTKSIPNKYAFQLFQNNTNVNSKIYKDGEQKLSQTKTQTLDHSKQLLEIGSWAGTVFASNIRDIQIYNKELTNDELVEVTN